MDIDADDDLRRALDVARRATTAVLAGDRRTAADVVREHVDLGGPEALALVLVLVDLSAWIHQCWCNESGVGVEGSWRELMLYIEASDL